MSERTNISWADHTASPWYGCAKVDPACANCYAEQWAKKLKIGWGDGAPRVRSKSFWNDVPRWQRNAAIDHLTGKPKPRIFPSLCDVFDQRAPVEWKANYWDVVMRSVNLDHLTLTKRPEFWKADMEAVNRFAQ
jgi:protein gp37